MRFKREIVELVQTSRGVLNPGCTLTYLVIKQIYLISLELSKIFSNKRSKSQKEYFSIEKTYSKLCVPEIDFQHKFYDIVYLLHDKKNTPFL